MIDFPEVEQLFAETQSWKSVARRYNKRHETAYTANALRCACTRRRKRPAETPQAPIADSYREPLIRLARKGVAFSQACDELDLSPRRLRDAIEDLRSAGFAVEDANGRILLRPAAEAARPVAIGSYASEGCVCVASDIHFGSQYHCRDEMIDHITTCHKAGATVTLIPGDLLEGNYRHSQFELTDRGIDAQANLAMRGLPKLTCHQYVLITGNHDETFGEANGCDVGRALLDYARRENRSDIRILGARGAMLQYLGTPIYLWHPRKNAAYSRSYHLQNWIRDRGDAPKPDILVAGHWHQSCYVQLGKCHAFSAGTFQHGDSAFGLSIGGGVALGGWLLQWNRNEHRITSLTPTWRSYWRASSVETIEDGGAS
jgi:predicted phosphodiesterase